MKRKLLSSLVLAVCAIVVPAPAPAEWTWSAGPVMRGGMEMRARGSSCSQEYGMRPQAPDLTRSYELPQPICPCWPTWDDGTYDVYRAFRDGHVSDGGLSDGHTSDWGYSDAGQYDAASGTLTFHRDITRSRPAYAERMREYQTLYDDLSVEKDLTGEGVEIAALRPVYSLTGRFRADVGVGVSGFWGMRARSSTTTYEASVLREWVELPHSTAYLGTFVYSTEGQTPPPAPYDGRGSEDGMRLPSRPQSVTYAQSEIYGSELIRDSATSRGYNLVLLDVDAALYELWLGPVISVAPAKSVSFALRPQLALNLVDVAVERSESWHQETGGQTMEATSWHDTRHTTDWIPGAGIHGVLQYDLGQGWFAGVSGGYDWLFRNVSAGIGPDTVTLDLSGYTLSALVGRNL